VDAEDPKFESWEVTISYVSRPQRWTLWDRLKAAWEIFRCGESRTGDVLFSYKRARAMAEYILTEIERYEGKRKADES